MFADALGLPAFYGRNMDAWIDCMTSIDDPHAGMSSVTVKAGEILTLEIEDVASFSLRCPEQFESLLDCSAFVNWRRLERGEPSVLALSYARGSAHKRG